MTSDCNLCGLVDNCHKREIKYERFALSVGGQGPAPSKSSPVAVLASDCLVLMPRYFHFDTRSHTDAET